MKGLVLLVLALFALSTADFCTDLEAAFADVVAAKPENVIARLPPVGTDVPQTVDAYIAWVRQFFAWEPTVEQAAAIEAAVGTRWETIKTTVNGYTALQITAAKACLAVKRAEWDVAYTTASSVLDTYAAAARALLATATTNIHTFIETINAALGECRERDVFDTHVALVSARIQQRIQDFQTYVKVTVKENLRAHLDSADAILTFLDDPTNVAASDNVKAQIRALIAALHEAERLEAVTASYVAQTQAEVQEVQDKLNALNNNFQTKLNALKAEYPGAVFVPISAELREKIGQLFAEQSLTFSVDTSTITVKLVESQTFPGKAFTLDFQATIDGTDTDNAKIAEFKERLRRLLIVEYSFHCTETKTSIPVIPGGVAKRTTSAASVVTVSFGMSDQSASTGLVATLLVFVLALFFHIQ